MPLPIGKILSSLREAKHLSQRDVAELLCRSGVNVTNQAVCKWENGNSLPNARQFIALCRIYDVRDVLDTFLDIPSSDIFDELNDNGREKALEYISLLRASGLYTAPKPDATRMLPLYLLGASAGTGQFLDNSDYELVSVGSDVPANANFGVYIAGDSMEPRYKNGQIVWVRQQQVLQNGEIGIFLYQGESYCKKLYRQNGELSLVSINPDYKPIVIEFGEELRVFGKVVN